nr:MAG: putative RNA-dependent RNA polymerase [Totiviridae sp.]
MLAKSRALSLANMREGAGLRARDHDFRALVGDNSFFMSLRPYYKGIFSELFADLHLDKFFYKMRGVNVATVINPRGRRTLGPKGMMKHVDDARRKVQFNLYTYNDFIKAIDGLALRTLAYEERPIQIPITQGLLIDFMYWLSTAMFSVCIRKGAICGLTRGGCLLFEYYKYFEPNPGLGHGRLPSKECLLHIFPRKTHPLAGRKANLFLDCVLADLREVMPQTYAAVLRLIGAIAPGMFSDDQFCSALMYAYAASKHVPFFYALGYALMGCYNSMCSKMFSDYLKAIGATKCVVGCIMVEVNTLSGRGVNRCDLVADAMLRIGRGKQHKRVVNIREQVLREAIRYILHEELGDTRPECSNLDLFWHQRFRWCVAGNHSKAANRHWDRRINYVPPHGRVLTRRICAEYTAENPLRTWNGNVGVSLAEKVEHGKSRAIYSCDTLSYFAFSWILKPVEEAWAGKRVILDPGKDGRVGIFNRIGEAYRQPGSQVFVMADYADFNSQHSLRSQQILFEEVLDHCKGVDERMRRLLISSFGLMDCYYKGQHLGRINSTMMSGHRGTTFINSILNAAYCYAAWGPQVFRNTTTFHVGDDVIAFVRDEVVGWEMLDKLTMLGCELQRSKQSVGGEVFEFLRMAGHPSVGAYGYLARSVAGLSSGNWVTDFVMEPKEGLASLINQARSIINRSDNPHAYRLMLSSAEKITGLNKTDLAPLLSGEVALAPGPCYRNDGRYMYRTLVDLDGLVADVCERDAVLQQPLNASMDYLEKGLHFVEKMAVVDAGHAPLTAMAFASYGRMEPSRRGAPGIGFRRGCLRLTGLRTVLKVGTIHTNHVTSTEIRHGVLACYPVAQLLRHELSDAVVRSMLTVLGYRYTETSLMEIAWGAEHTGSIIKGWIPYSDAAGIAARFATGTVVVDLPIKL